MHATLNLFINSRSYLESKNIQIGSELNGIDIEIHQTLETGKHTSLFDTFENLTVPVTGDGQYVQLNVTGMVAKWFHSHNTTHGLMIKVKSTVDGSVLPHGLVALETGNLLKVSGILLMFIESFALSD